MEHYGPDHLNRSGSSFTVGEAVIVVDDKGRYLLQKDPHIGWCLPGGIPNPEETKEDAARRFVEELTGLTINTLHMLDFYYGKRLFPLENNEETSRYISMTFVSRDNHWDDHKVEEETWDFFNINDLPLQTIPQIKDLLFQLTLKSIKNKYNQFGQ